MTINICIKNLNICGKNTQALTKEKITINIRYLFLLFTGNMFFLANYR